MSNRFTLSWMRKAFGPALVLVCSSILLAQPARENGLAMGNLPLQKIGANDLISLSVYQAPELTRTVRVSPEGKIRLPMLKQLIQADGLFPSELETSLVEALRSEQILVAPVVTVNVVEYHSRPISVAGAVHKPTTFQAIGAVTLLDAVTRAEGLKPDAGPEILVSRRQPGPDGNQISLIQRIPVRGLMDAADPELNIRLYGGEEIRVPEAGKIFVVGNVRKPGSYPVHDASDTTVLKMLALSEGLMPFAGQQAFIYRREDGSGVKNEIPIELKKIMDRKTADVPLQPNDILYIPDNRARRVGITALERILTFGAATASGLLIYGTVR
ncbi:MAG: polysaccharide biosynthesis/export family protein [Acidobacteriia bacterium]|nr:polysaccharide biosynthesis/export family protein [Terriglobia bacterium]